ncbi:MAG: hypothetical protein MUO26_14875 [Methanotrichaceae archaeon]|nr:hypothetical protein [Methanotrichaceae archaeon]
MQTARLTPQGHSLMPLSFSDRPDWATSQVDSDELWIPGTRARTATLLIFLRRNCPSSTPTGFSDIGMEMMNLAIG